MIKLKNLNKSFNLDSNRSIVALQDINLEIGKSEIFGIIGLSGAGKSTLIRTINRLEEPCSGTIEIDGIDITKLSKSELIESRRGMGMIFQHFNLLSSRTVAQNIAFPLEIAGVEKSIIKTRVDELLELVELSDKSEAYPSQLSGGQKQRVAIARALANNPKVLLCDEATSALDPNTTKSILKLLKDINQKLNITIILITHQMEVIKSICNRVAIIEAGRIIELGSVEAVFLNPRTQTAKEFLSHLQPSNQIETCFPKDKNSIVLKLSYLKASAKEPIVSRLIRKFDLDVNIVSGNISKLMSTSSGHLVLQLIGAPDILESSLEYLNSQQLLVEVVWSA